MSERKEYALYGALNVTYGYDEEDPTYIRQFKNTKALVSVRIGSSESGAFFCSDCGENIEVRYPKDVTLNSKQLVVLSRDTGNTWTLDIEKVFDYDEWRNFIRVWWDSHDIEKLYGMGELSADVLVDMGLSDEKMSDQLNRLSV